MRTLLACSGGGHLKQLSLLVDAMGVGVGDRVWFTFDNGLSRSILSGEQIHFIPYVRPRSLRGTATLLREAASVIRTESIEAAISTGAIPGFAALSAATVHGIPAHYIESVARVSSPSVTGRLMSLNPRAHLYAQHPGWAGSRWRYRGSIFDRFSSATRADSIHELHRVVVTVGTTQGYAFSRLYRALVPLLAGHEVLWQTGSDDVTAFDIASRPQIGHQELQEAMTQADVVIAHAGTGSALSALEAGKLPILIPRLKRYGEHIDDHQLQIAEDLEQRGLALSRRPDKLNHDDLLRAANTEIALAAAPSFQLD